MKRLAWMRRRGVPGSLAAVLLVVAALLLWSLLQRSDHVQQDKATWLWDAAGIAQKGDEIISFCAQEGVKVIFVQIQSEVRKEDYRRFAAGAYAAGIAVHALDGQPEWAYEEHRGEVSHMLSWLAQYNAESQPEERFQGIQLDIEPYVLKRWERERDQVVLEWAGNMEAWAADAAASGIPLSVAVPFWLDDIPALDDTDNFCLWLQQRTAAIAVMSYRDQGEQMYELARQELEQGEQLGTSVWIGMELADTDEGDHLTFHDQTLSQMELEAQRASFLGRAHRSYAGLAVHHFEAWHHKWKGTGPLE
ncbi:hypothetical protein [Paenibacillus sp. F411]|uniref:hypothetical protein n=1 Tax=Paenibacillus sp. F411 TaxID=2820239 RepID=UPI001FBAACC6|nr:hypothetical protein [Paenibacillus sp. F411]